MFVRRPIASLVFFIISIFSITQNTNSSEPCDENDPYCKSKLGNNGNSNKDNFSSDETQSRNNLGKIDGLNVGHTQSISLSTGGSLEMITVSMKPQVIVIPNFLSPEECQYFISVAEETGLKPSGTVSEKLHSKGINLMDVNQDQRLSVHEMMLTIEDSYDMYLSEDDILEMYRVLAIDTNKDEYITPEEIQQINAVDMTNYLGKLAMKQPVKQSRYSHQVWLFPDTSKDKIFVDVQRRVQEVTKLPDVMIKKSDFQVVQYGVGGHYNAHQDSNHITKQPCCTRSRTKSCRICRLMTILFYLNDVEEGGGTAFPLAGNDTYNEQVFRESHHVNLQRYCHMAGHVVKPEMGKAVIWYNHHIDDKTGWVGELDEYTWHGGCPVIRGEKWIANFWIKFTDNKKKKVPTATLR